MNEMLSPTHTVEFVKLAMGFACIMTFSNFTELQPLLLKDCSFTGKLPLTAKILDGSWFRLSSQPFPKSHLHFTICPGDPMLDKFVKEVAVFKQTGLAVKSVTG